MKRLIVTAAFGQNFVEMASLSIPTMEAYAKKIGADFLALRDKYPPYKDLHPFWSKLCIYDLLESYDEVLWLDCDTLVLPKAENIFEAAGGKFSATQETYHKCYMPRFINLYEAIRNKQIVDTSKIVYVNTGIFVIPRSERFLLQPDMEMITRIDELGKRMTLYYDQEYINLQLYELKLPVTYLPYSWNAVCYPGVHNWQTRRQCNIIHYAGMVGHRRIFVMYQDLQAIKEGI